MQSLARTRHHIPHTHLSFHFSTLKSPVALARVKAPSSHEQCKELCAKVSDPPRVNNRTAQANRMRSPQRAKRRKSVAQVLPVTTVDLDNAGEQEDDGHALGEVCVHAVGEVEGVCALVVLGGRLAVVGAGAEAGADDVEGEEDGGEAECGDEAAGDGWEGCVSRRVTSDDNWTTLER